METIDLTPSAEGFQNIKRMLEQSIEANKKVIERIDQQLEEDIDPDTWDETVGYVTTMFGRDCLEDMVGLYRTELEKRNEDMQAAIDEINAKS